MSIEFDEVFVEVVGQSSVGNVPELDGAVLCAAGDDVVVERVPFDVRHRATVTINLKSKKERKTNNFDAKLSEILIASILRNLKKVSTLTKISARNLLIFLLCLIMSFMKRF